MDTNKDTLYARWLAGQLSTEEEQALQTSGELEELEVVIDAADKLTLPKYDAEVGYAHFKTNRIQPKAAKVRSLNSRRIWTMLAAAASVLLLIYVGNLFLSGPNAIETGNMATLSHQFKDQSFVVLNDGSSLVYEEDNWSEERLVKLTGEAIFNVQKGKPFIVNTNSGKVEVLGTSFNVRAWSTNLNVECYEGSVRVRYANQEVILTAGESVNGISGKLREKQTIQYEKPLWTTGSSRFRDEPVFSVLEELERQYDVKVNMPKINSPFNGDFQHDDLETALRKICLPMGLKWEIVGEGKIVNITQ